MHKHINANQFLMVRSALSECEGEGVQEQPWALSITQTWTCIQALESTNHRLWTNCFVSVASVYLCIKQEQ